MPDPPTICAIICRIEQASPSSRATSLGLNQLKQPLRVVGALLLRHQQREAVMLCQRRPAGAEIIARRRLAAAMQHHDQRGRRLQLGGHERRTSGVRPGLTPKRSISTSGLSGTGRGLAVRALRSP